MTGSGLNPESISPNIHVAPWILRCAIAHHSSLVQRKIEVNFVADSRPE
jgi:hypothetical protein